MAEHATQLDERAMCPTSGQLCVAKAALLAQFGDVTEQYRRGPVDAFPIEMDDDDDWNGEDGTYPRSHYSMSPEADGVKLSGQLVEYGIVARAIRCEGPVDDDCPTRQKMVESSTRSGLLTILRKFIDI